MSRVTLVANAIYPSWYGVGHTGQDANEFCGLDGEVM